MTSILFILGIVALVAGVALWSIPAAFVVGGSAVAAIAVALELGGGETR